MGVTSEQKASMLIDLLMAQVYHKLTDDRKDTLTVGRNEKNKAKLKPQTTKIMFKKTADAKTKKMGNSTCSD